MSFTGELTSARAAKQVINCQLVHLVLLPDGRTDGQTLNDGLTTGEVFCFRPAHFLLVSSLSADGRRPSIAIAAASRESESVG